MKLQVCQPYASVVFTLKRYAPQGRSADGRIKLMKNEDNPLRIEPMIPWLAAQCLNQLRHRVPTDINTGNFLVYS